MRVSLETTHHCNLNCAFCESHSPLMPSAITERREYVGGRRTMSLETVAALCRSLARMRVRRVELSGKGEPMAHPEVAEVIRIIKQAGMIGLLVTNGTLAREGLAACVVEVGLDWLHVSLNAASPEVYARIAGQDAWGRAVAFLREVLERKRAAGARRPWVKVSYVLCRENADEVQRMTDLCCEWGLDEISYDVMGETPQTVHLRADEQQVSRMVASIPRWRRQLDAAGVRHSLARLAAELPLRMGSEGRQENPLQRSLPCYDGWMFSVIGPDGAVVPCCPCENIRLGNITQQDFSDVWYGERYQEFRRRSLEMPRTGKPVCWECLTTCNRALENQRIGRFLGPLRPR